MGLTIYYQLSVEQNQTVAVVRELVERVALYARKIGCAEVGKVASVKSDTPFTSLFVSVGKPEAGCFGLIPAKRGRVVTVWPGEGCENATFGLCQYPRRVLSRTGYVPTGYEMGWLLKGACKTQYAGEHGWEHFLKCHRQIISLLDFWRELGVTVAVTDEGGYWETRDEKQLRASVERYDGLVAAVAGMMKDAADEKGKCVASPIFARKDFERLEAAGQREFKAPLSQLAREPLI